LYLRLRDLEILRPAVLEPRPGRERYAEFVDLHQGLSGFDELDAGTVIDHAARVDEPLDRGESVAADVVLLFLPDLRDAEVAVFGDGELRRGLRGTAFS
jgi:hypothetical protein